MNRVLLLSYAFPPVSLPESYLSAKSMGNLEDHQVDVIAADPASNNLSSDDSLLKYVDDRFDQVKRVRAPGFFKYLPKGRLPCSRLPIVCTVPDSFVYLNRSVVSLAESLDLSRYMAIVTWSQWHSIHLAGAAIKKKHPSLKWIARLSDPWVDNPYATFGALARRVNERMERKVVENADRVVLTTVQTVDLVMKKYPNDLRERVRVIPHPYEPRLYGPAAEFPDGRPLTLRYIGYFYGDRSPEPLFRALRMILEQEPDTLRGVIFEFVGEIDSRYFESPSYQALPPELVQVVPSVDYLESLSLMASAGALLVIDAPAKVSVFLPSKLVDYVGAGRPIIGITPPGASADLIRECGGVVADTGDDRGIAAIITQMVQALKAERRAAQQKGAEKGDFTCPLFGRTPEEVAEVRERYSVRAVSAQMNDLINEVTNSTREQP